MSAEKKPRAGKKKTASKTTRQASAPEAADLYIEPDTQNEPALIISQILDFLPDPTFAIDLSGKVILWNRAMEKLTQVGADKMMGKSDYEYSLTIYGIRRPLLADLVLHPHHDIEKNYASLLHQNDSIYAEATGLPLKRHLWIKASPLYDKAGRVIGAIETIRDITDSKLTESALKKSEAKYRDFFTNVSDYLYLHDLQGNFIETNLATKKGSGYTQAEIVGLSVKELLPERHKHRFQNYIQNVLSKGTDEGFLTIRNKFGVERVLEYRNSLVTDHDGKPVAVRGSARDITSRIRAQQELKRERNFVTSIIQTSPAFYDAVDPGGKTIFMNEAMLNALGYRLEDVVGRDYMETFIPKEDHPGFTAALERMLSSKAPVVHENRLLTRIGEALTVQWQGKAVFKENGDVEFIFGIGIDVSEYRRAEKLILESEKKFQAAFHSIPEPICIINSSTRRITDVNRAFILWSGFDRGAVIGKTTAELNVWVNPGDRIWYMNELIEGNNVEDVEVKLKNSSGMIRDVILSATLVDVEGKSYIFALIHDITDLRTAEKKITEHKRKLETLMGNMPGMAYRCRNDSEWTMEFVSEGSRALTGYASEELIGNTVVSFNEIIHPLDRERIWKEVQYALEARVHFQLEYRIVTRSREVRWVWEQGIGVYSPEGDLLFLEGFITDITERKHAEEELLESERRYRQLIDQAADGIFLIDHTGRFILVNAKTCEMLGYDETELLGLGILDTYPDEMRELGQQRLSVLASGETLRFERPMKRKDGSVFLVEASASKLPDGRLQAIIHDITARKRSDADLQKNRLLLEHAQKIAGIGYWEFDLTRGTVWASPEAYVIYGLGQNQWTIEEVKKIPLPEYRAVLDNAMQQLVHSGLKYDLEFKIRRPTDGAIVDIHSVAEYNKAENKVFGIIQDITERKRAEEALRQSEERFRKMAEASPEIFWITLPDLSKVIYLSPAFEKVTGMPCADIYADPGLWLELIHPDDKDFVLKQVENREDAEHEYEFRVVRKDGTVRWIRNRRSTICDSEGALIYLTGIAEDITEKKQIEEQRTTYENRLMRAQKLEAIGTLAGGIAHDFNNILSAIIGYSELARDDLSEGNPTIEYVEEVLKAGSRAKDLVKQILTFSRQIEPEQHPVQVHLIVKEALKLLRSSIPSIIAISQDIDTSTDPILADPTQIHQIIMNLCTNSYQAMLPDGGELTVTLDEVSVGPEFTASHPELSQGKHVRIVVSDTGCGMDAETLKRIFDPFFTTKEKGKGTGLGLATVHGIVTALGGAVLVRSKVAQGTTFEVYLPVMSTAEEEADEPDDLLMQGNGESILLVDDEEAILQFARAMLEQLGYRVRSMSSSIRALELFRSSPDAFDLILTDMTMPGMTGASLAVEAMKIRPVPVILMTGYSETITPEEALAKGIEEYIEKPFTRHTIVRAIQRCLMERNR